MYKKKVPSSVEILEVSLDNQLVSKKSGFFARLFNMNKPALYICIAVVTISRVRLGRGYFSPIKEGDIVKTFDGNFWKVDLVTQGTKIDILTLISVNSIPEVKIMSNTLQIVTPNPKNYEE